MDPRPLLLLSVRAEEPAAVDERASFLRFSGLGEADLHLVNLCTATGAEVDLDEWSGVVLGGGPFNVSDDEAAKTPVQRRVEAWLDRLLDEVVERDVPFLGACYGIGTLGRHQGGLVDRTWPETVGPLSVSLTQEGVADPLFAGVPRDFTAYGGHKEALTEVPASATVLATSAACPVQAFRVGRRVYATQFHPELDLAGLCTRIDVYRHAGYFDPGAAEDLKEAGRRVEVRHPMRLLRNFAALARGEDPGAVA